MEGGGPGQAADTDPAEPHGTQRGPDDSGVPGATPATDDEQIAAPSAEGPSPERVDETGPDSAAAAPAPADVDAPAGDEAPTEGAGPADGAAPADDGAVAASARQDSAENEAPAEEDVHVLAARAPATDAGSESDPAPGRRWSSQQLEGPAFRPYPEGKYAFADQVADGEPGAEKVVEKSAEPVAEPDHDEPDRDEPGEADGGSPFVQAQGWQLVVAGEPVRLEAMNFSNYYYEELTGPELMASRHHGEADFESLRGLGFNSVRLAFHGDWYVEDQDGFWRWLDRNVEWAAEHDMWLVLDLHRPVGGSASDRHDDSYAMWSDDALRQQNLELWREIAERYADEPTIAAYDILNEPVTADSTGQQWERFARDAVATIREVDQQHLLMVGALMGVDRDFGADGLDRHFLVDDDNVVYDFHLYEPFSFTHQGASWLDPGERGVRYSSGDDREYVERVVDGYLDFGREHDVPMSVMELGTMRSTFDGLGGEQWVEDVLSILQARELSFGYWEYRGRDMGVYVGGDDEPSRPNDVLIDVLRRALDGEVEPERAARPEDRTSSW